MSNALYKYRASRIPIVIPFDPLIRIIPKRVLRSQLAIFRASRVRIYIYIYIRLKYYNTAYGLCTPYRLSENLNEQLLFGTHRENGRELL